jgi:hypothetical protein
MSTSTSFYNLDYIIEKIEKRLDNLSGLYQKLLERFTNIILIYSAIAIFLVAIIQDLFWNKITHWLFISAFALFSLLFIYSLIFTIRLLIPVEIAHLDSFKKYYETYRLRYEAEIKDHDEVDKLLKASYIDELEEAVERNAAAFRRKSHFYYSALTYSLISAAPYLVCLGFHIAQKEDAIHKVSIVNQEEISNFNQNSDMPKGSRNTTKSTTTTTTTTKLPGVDTSKVIPSSPTLIKENSHTPSTKQK